MIILDYVSAEVRRHSLSGVGHALCDVMAGTGAGLPRGGPTGAERLTSRASTYHAQDGRLARLFEVTPRGGISAWRGAVRRVPDAGYEGCNVRIATICARGGSTGVPGKNIRPLLGKPLITWTIEQAFASGLFNGVFVSTDSAEIARVAAAAGAQVPFTRPADLATASAAKLPVIRLWSIESKERVQSLAS